MGEKAPIEKKKPAKDAKPSGGVAVATPEAAPEAKPSKGSSSSDSKKNSTVVRPHNCKNAGQDALHGHGNRVMNGSGKGWRCTACGNIG